MALSSSAEHVVIIGGGVPARLSPFDWQSVASV